MKRLRFLAVVLIVIIGMAMNTFEYKIDDKLEPFYLASIEDLKDVSFDFPYKKGVAITFIDKQSDKQHSDGIAWAIPHKDYSLIRVYERHFKHIDYWQKRWVVTHELLHTFGYGHSDDPRSIMYWDIPEDVSSYDYYNALEFFWAKESK